MNRDRVALWSKCTVAALLTAFALSVDIAATVASGLSAESWPDFVFAFYYLREGDAPIYVILVLALMGFYHKLLSPKEKLLPSAAVTGALFALFFLVGQSYEALDSAQLIFGNRYLFILSVLMFCGYLVFFYVLSAALFRKLDSLRLPAVSGPRQPFVQFLIYFGIIFLCWLPTLLICYPGSLSYDGMFQLGQYLGNTPMTGHHPWPATMLMGTIVDLGRGVSLELGVFLYVLFQSLVCSAAFGATCLSARQVLGKTAAVLSLLFFALVPTWSAYAQFFVKDTIFFGVFAAFFLSVVLFVHTRGRCSWLVWAGLFVTGIASTLLRNNGLYIVVTSILVLVFAADSWKKRGALVLTGAVILALNLFVSQTLMPSLGIEPGSVREMLSLPFQQTARYAIEYSEELTAEDIEIIDAVLDYETVITQYDPRGADPVKNTYRGDGESLKEYFKLWLRCGLKHPGVYLEATWDMVFGYFLPGYRFGTYGGHYFSIAAPQYEVEIHFAHPDAVYALDSLSRLFSVIPGALLLSSPGTFSWVLIWCCAALLRRRKWLPIVATLPLWLSLAINCVSPVNGLLRYALPMMASTPLLIVFTIAHVTEREKGETSEYG